MVKVVKITLNVHQVIVFIMFVEPHPLIVEMVTVIQVKIVTLVLQIVDLV